MNKNHIFILAIALTICLIAMAGCTSASNAPAQPQVKTSAQLSDRIVQRYSRQARSSQRGFTGIPGIRMPVNRS